MVPALILMAACTAGPEPEFFVADQLGQRVVHVAGGEVRVVTEAAAWAGGLAPSAVEVHGDELWVADFTDGRVHAIDRDTGAYRRLLWENRRNSLRLEEPCAIQAVGGDLWVLGNDSRNLVVTGADGDYAYGESQPLRSAHGFARHDGRVYVATSPTEWGLGLVQVLDEATGERVGHFAAYGEVLDGTGVAVDGDTLLVADWFGDQVVRYGLDGEWLGVVAGPEDGLDRPVSVVVHDGQAYLLDQAGVARIGDDGADRLVSAAELDLQFGRNLAVVSAVAAPAP